MMWLDVSWYDFFEGVFFFGFILVFFFVNGKRKITIQVIIFVDIFFYF